MLQIITASISSSSSNQQQKPENHSKLERDLWALSDQIPLKQTKVCQSGPWSSIFIPATPLAGLETVMCSCLSRGFKAVRFSNPKKPPPQKKPFYVWLSFKFLLQPILGGNIVL